MADETNKDDESKDDPLATIKALGFDTIEAYDKAKQEELDKVKKTNEDTQEMVKRQAKEIGDLRTTLKDKSNSDGKGGNNSDQATNKEDDEKKYEGDELDKMTYAEIQESLTDEELEAARKSVLSQPEEMRNLVSQSEETQAEFLRQFVRAKDSAPDQLFARKTTPRRKQEDDFKKQIQAMFQTASGHPVVPDVPADGIPGMGRTPEEVREYHAAAAKKSQANPGIRGGDLLGSLNENAQLAGK